jgi:hypothetical protein
MFVALETTAVERLRQRYGQLLHQAVAQTVDSPDECYLAVGYMDGCVKLSSFPTGQQESSKAAKAHPAYPIRNARRTTTRSPRPAAVSPLASQSGPDWTDCHGCGTKAFHVPHQNPD